MTDLTPDEHRTLAEASQLEGSICAVLSLLFGAGGVTWVTTFRWEGMILFAVAALLLAAANRAFTCADIHHSTAHQETR